MTLVMINIFSRMIQKFLVNNFLNSKNNWLAYDWWTGHMKEKTSGVIIIASVLDLPLCPRDFWGLDYINGASRRRAALVFVYLLIRAALYNREPPTPIVRVFSSKFQNCHQGDYQFSVKTIRLIV